MDLPANQAAALYLGAALRKTFPRITYLGSSADERGFHVQFRDKARFEKSLLSLLENSMRKFSSESLVVREMLASNAAELFSHAQEDLLADVLRGSKEVVHVAEIGGYYDVCTKEASPTKHFALLDFKQEGSDITITGIAFPSQKELKKFFKLYHNYPQKNHTALAKQLGLYEQNFWHPKGINLLYALKEKWKHTLEERGVLEIGPADPKEYFAFTGAPQFCFWQDGKDSIFSFSASQPIFPLQIMQKWIKIFDFEAKWVLPSFSRRLLDALEECKIPYVKRKSGNSHLPRVEVHIADGLGLYWLGPVLEWRKDRIEFTLFGDLPRFVALLLERTEGKLPFWLCPEQVRVLPIGDVSDTAIKNILDLLKLRYTIDRGQGVLKEKMHRALRAKVPYVMVFGQKEQKEGTVKIRACGSNHEETMTLDELKHFLVEQAT